MNRGFSWIMGALLLFLLLPGSSRGQLEPFGLGGERINALAIFPGNLRVVGSLLSAASDSKGVFIREADVQESLWTYWGLAGKNSHSLFIQQWGAGPLIGYRLFAGVRPDKTSGDSTLLYVNQLDSANAWRAVDSTLDVRNIPRIKAVCAVHYEGHLPPGPVFIAGGGEIYRSGAPGLLPWVDIWPPLGPGVVNVIERYPPGIRGSAEILWSGGENSIFWPFLAKSADNGKSWEIFYPDLKGDNACNAIAIVAGYPDTVYAGMEGAVIKTIDGGKTWSITALQDTPYYFFGIAANPENPDHVLAGGASSTYHPALFETFNGGDFWTEIPFPDNALGVSAMVADITPVAFVAYIGTLGDGVYRYTSPLVNLPPAPGNPAALNFQLRQNFPNPFNPGTTIRYFLPKAGRVVLGVYDILGEKIVTLVDGIQTAGEKSVIWDGRNATGEPLSSGIYIYRIRVGRSLQSRKMLLLR